MPVTDEAFSVLRDRVSKAESRLDVRDETLRTIETRLFKIETILSRLTWLMVASIVGAAMTFILSGGFNVPSL